MTEHDEERRARRLEDVINRLRKGRQPEIGPEDAADAPAIRAASRLAGARDPYPRMDPAFRRHLAARLTSPRASNPSRRWALAAAAGIVGGAALGVAGDRVLEGRPPGAGGIGQQALVPERPTATWVDTGVAFSDLSEGTPRQVTVGGLPVFLVRQGQQVRALSSICTHKPCQLVWDDAADRIVCPWGRYQSFSLDGTSLNQELPSLPQGRVRVEEDRVFLYGVS
jgi:nitrite reductase/ring-hydroxylating ferredoxin subunit